MSVSIVPPEDLIAVGRAAVPDLLSLRAAVAERFRGEIQVSYNNEAFYAGIQGTHGGACQWMPLKDLNIPCEAAGAIASGLVAAGLPMAGFTLAAPLLRLTWKSRMAFVRVLDGPLPAPGAAGSAMLPASEGLPHGGRAVVALLADELEAMSASERLEHAMRRNLLDDAGRAAADALLERSTSLITAATRVELRNIGGLVQMALVTRGTDLRVEALAEIPAS